MGGRNDSGLAFWRANAANAQRLHGRGGDDARARHRREHGHLQCGVRSVVSPAPLFGAGAVGCHELDKITRRLGPVFEKAGQTFAYFYSPLGVYMLPYERLRVSRM